MGVKSRVRVVHSVPPGSRENCVAHSSKRELSPRSPDSTVLSDVRPFLRKDVLLVGLRCPHGIRATLDILPRDRHAIFELPSASVIYPIVRIIGLLTASAVGPIVRSLWRTSCRSVCVARARLLRDLRSLLIERHFSERQYHRTSYGLRCWSDRLFSSEDFSQVGLRCPHAASARPKKSSDL